MPGPNAPARQTAALLARLLRAHATADELPAVEALAAAAEGTDTAALERAKDAVAPLVERLQPPPPPPSGTRRTARCESTSVDAGLVADLRAATASALAAAADMDRAIAALDAALARVAS